MDIIPTILETPLLQLVAGFGYLIGHLFLSRQQILGWLIKILGGSAWVVFLFQSQNYIWGAVTVVIVMTMFYGWYKWSQGNHDEYTSIDTFFEYLAILVASMMIGRFLWSGDYQLAPIFETVIVTAEISATVLLARKKLMGWYCCIVMSLFATILVIFINPESAPILGLLEFASIYFYLKGIKNFS